MPDSLAISVRLAATAAEVRAAQRLRYKVFYQEWGAIPDAVALSDERDAEAFDQVTEHLIVIDHARAAAGIDCGVVGNYRLLRSEGDHTKREFYSTREFDISRLLHHADMRLLELGRSCVLREYRGRSVLQSLWKALAQYVAEHRIDLMFGCASFRGTDAAPVAEALAYLHHHHLAQPELRPKAIGENLISMNRLPQDETDPVRAIRAMEPLIRGYLRLGASVGEGACIDRQFNTIDVCIVLPTADLAAKYVRHYEREGQLKLRDVARNDTAILDEVV
ncbi:MAG: GNAT family N-acetyltransferase [Pseudomonadota bacterium]|nr:GNAT family N-acetyltransferase [Pseudomonadota bacterium]